jgi:hypothetical protein
MSPRASAAQVDALRDEITQAIQHGTELIADLKAVTRSVEALLPDLDAVSETARWNEVARLTGLEPETPERLGAVVEALADLLADLTPADGGAAWLAHQQARLAAGEDAAA